MKSLLISLLVLAPLASFAETLLVTAKVLDRANDGSAIPNLYVYPSVELESGEMASLHIGNAHRFPVWTQKVDLGEGVTKQETVYEEEEIGFIFSLKYELNEEGIITYRGKGVSKVSMGTANSATVTRSAEIIFHGKTELGGVVEVAFEGPEGTAEDIAIHFGPAPE